MKFLKIFGITLITIILIALLVLTLFPFFKMMDMFLGMEPVIICAVLVGIGFVFSFIIKNPYLEKIFGYLLASLILGVVIFYILGGLGSGIPIWIIFVVVAAIVIPAFLTSVLKNIPFPFITEKVIPFIWIISIFSAAMTILRHTVMK